MRTADRAIGRVNADLAVVIDGNKLATPIKYRHSHVDTPTIGDLVTIERYGHSWVLTGVLR